MERKELLEILDLHEKYLNDGPDGKRANLRDADLNGADLNGAILRYADLRYADLRYADLRDAILRDADLSGAILRYAILSGAILRGADLRYADLNGAILRYADLRDADLRDAILRDADLSGADLRGADLRGADLRDADLREIKVNNNTEINYPPIACPEKGSFIGYKKAYLIKPANKISRYFYEYIPFIVELRITEDALRSSATSRKCRCSKAEVLSITNLDGSIASINEVYSRFNYDFIYKVGETVEVDIFHPDRWCECASGIHFFITRKEAVDY